MNALDLHRTGTFSGSADNFVARNSFHVGVPDSNSLWFISSSYNIDHNVLVANDKDGVHDAESGLLPLD